MIGKVKVTSSGYDPNGPAPHDPTLGPQPTREDLENEFTAHFAKKVRSGKTSPMDRIELLAVTIAFEWLIENYFVVKKEKK